jgi:hypothetical protein
MPRISALSFFYQNAPAENSFAACFHKPDGFAKSGLYRRGGIFEVSNVRLWSVLYRQ